LYTKRNRVRNRWACIKLRPTLPVAKVRQFSLPHVVEHFGLWARIETIMRWITSPHRLFDIAQENFYFYCFHLISKKGIDTPRSSRFAARDQVDRDFQKTILKKRKANKRVPEFLVRKITSCGNFRTICLTPLLNLRVWGVDNSLFLRCNNSQSWCDAHACEDTMHMLVRYGAHDAR
jgi:hypothetical protein